MKLGTMLLAAAVVLVGIAGCEGPRGPDGAAGTSGAPGEEGTAGENGTPGIDGTPGSTGPTGVTGTTGPVGPTGCDSSAVATLVPTVTVSAPANGQFFAAGEQAVLTIKFTDTCNRAVDVADLETAALYLTGPRKGSLTTTASKLLNCIVDRAAADKQHHFINLKAPKFLDTTQTNLATAADGTITLTLAPITTELEGTYTAGLRTSRAGGQDQAFTLADLQVKTATVEEYASGPTATSSCYECHKGTESGKSYQIHILPSSRSAFGSYSLDDKPIANCQMCHNQDGYSRNPIVRKVHGAHRGHKLTNPGVAHPEYGFAADNTLAEFANVGFPAMPNGEKDCAACHVDDRWQTPSRQACGTCHDNVFFDTGAISPPHVLGKAKLADGGSASCTSSAMCTSWYYTATCALDGGVDNGLCVAASHPVQSDDTACSGCHGAAGNLSVAAFHDIPTRTKVRGLKLAAVSLSGSSGGADGGVFLGVDTPVLKFKLTDAQDNNIADLLTNPKLAMSAFVAGPTNDRQRVYVASSTKGSSAVGTLTYDSTTSFYTYTFAGNFPGSSLAPLNAAVPTTRVNPAGTYTAYVYVTEAVTPPGGGSIRDVASATVDFRYLTAGAVEPRKVITQAACDSCHVNVQAHGGSRQVAEACSVCHTEGAEDKELGSKGLACKLNSECPGDAAATPWEACQNIPTDGGSGSCAIVVDPTPGQTIRFPVMIHAIHFARLREGYAARNNLVPGNLNIIGYRNSANDFDEVLFPQDVRNCTKCHAGTQAACGTGKPACGVGQSCTGGKCVNTAWKAPSTAVCLSCHDSAAAAGHAMLMTANTVDGPVETCTVCHAANAEFSVEKAHNISSPYKPPYPRE